MKQITEYIYLTEAWANTKNYKRELDDLLDKYKKKKEAEDKKAAKGKLGWYPSHKYPSEVLAKYPMQIIIDKMGYEPKTLGWRSKGKEKFNLADYGNFLLKQIEDKKISLEDLIKWWEEYDTEILKKNWHDPSWIIKQVDGDKLWDPFHPKSTHTIDNIVNNPASVLYYLKPEAKKWRLSEEERDELSNFYSDPVNNEALRVAFKGIRKKLEKLRPTFSSAVSKWMEQIMDITINGDRLESLLEQEYEDGNKSYYSGSNFRTNKGTAIVSIIYKTLKDLYDIDFTRAVAQDDEGNWIKTKHVVNNEDSPNLEKFTDDAPNMVVSVKDNGSVKDDTSGVWNSSFITSYNHSFTVTVKRKGEDDYVKEFPSVCVATDFYSGGWG